MFKRYIAAAAMLLMITMVFCRCGNTDSGYGKIESVELPTTEAVDEKAPAFERTESPFEDYTYTNIEFEAAKMTFEVPKTWKQDIYNQSCIRYNAPFDDPHFPGATMYVKCLYDYNAAEDDLDPFAHIASEFGKPLNSYITGLPFLYEGSTLWINSYSVADDVTTPTFTKDETQASTKITKDVVLIDRKTNDVHVTEGASFVASYLRWENFPVMICMVTPNENAENAKSMIEYIMSGIAYTPQKIKDVAGYQAGKVAFTLPSEFKAENAAGNILRSPSNSLKATAGMSIGIFKVEESLDILNEEYFQSSYADKVALMLCDPTCISHYTIMATSRNDSGEKLLDEKLRFYGDVNILSEGEDYTAASLTYGTAAVWCMNYYIAERGKNTYLIADMFPQQDAALAETIERNILTTLTEN